MLSCVRDKIFSNLFFRVPLVCISLSVIVWTNVAFIDGYKNSNIQNLITGYKNNNLVTFNNI